MTQFYFHLLNCFLKFTFSSPKFNGQKTEKFIQIYEMNLKFIGQWQEVYFDNNGITVGPDVWI